MSRSVTPMSDTVSPRSQRFRDSVHNIPTPGTDVQRPKRYEPLVLNIYIVGTIALLMICLGIALEIALRLSRRNNGFPVPEKNVFAFASTQTLTSFFSVLASNPTRVFLGCSRLDAQMVPAVCHAIRGQRTCSTQYSTRLYRTQSTIHLILFPQAPALVNQCINTHCPFCHLHAAASCILIPGTTGILHSSCHRNKHAQHRAFTYHQSTYCISRFCRVCRCCSVH